MAAKKTAQQRAAQQRAARQKAQQRKAKRQTVTVKPTVSIDSLDHMSIRELEKVITCFNAQQTKKMWDSQALQYLMVKLPNLEAPAIMPEEAMNSGLQNCRTLSQDRLRVIEILSGMVAEVSASVWGKGLEIDNSFQHAVIYRQLLLLFARAGLADITPVSPAVLPPEPNPDDVTEKQYADYSADLTRGAKGYSFVAAFREEMVRISREFRKQFIAIENVLSYRYKADYYLDWLISYRLTNVDQRVLETTPLEQRWVRIPAEYSKNINAILKSGAIAPAYFMAVPVARWNVEDSVTLETVAPYVYFPDETPVGFHPLAEWSIHEHGIREELSAISKENYGRVVKISTNEEDLEIEYRREETAVEISRYGYYQPWIFQYVRDNPQHADYLAQVLNCEADGMDKERSFEEQIQAVEIPKPVGEYTPVPVTTAAK